MRRPGVLMCLLLALPSGTSCDGKQEKVPSEPVRSAATTETAAPSRSQYDDRSTARIVIGRYEDGGPCEVVHFTGLQDAKKLERVRWETIDYCGGGHTVSVGPFRKSDKIGQKKPSNTCAAKLRTYGESVGENPVFAGQGELLFVLSGVSG